MEEQKKLSIETLNEEYDILREKYKLEYELQRLKQNQREELLNQKERKAEEEKYRLLNLETSDLLLKLEFENNLLKTNLALLEKQHSEQKSLPIKFGLTFSSVLGAASIAFTIIPFLKNFYDIPQIVVSISIVFLFIAGIWIYSNWRKLSTLKNRKYILSNKIIQARELYEYTSKVLSSNYDKIINLETSNTEL